LREHDGCLLVLHPFRDRLEAEPTHEVDQRVDEGTVVVGAVEVLHESAVDLDDIDAAKIASMVLRHAICDIVRVVPSAVLIRDSNSGSPR
jgi:hypothetical protein